MFSKINTILGTIDAYVWGIPLIVLILAVGLFLTIRLKGVQFTNLGRAFKYIFKDETDGKHGEVSSFAALCTALSATIGTGNIVGVATAIVSGGPGALFWMWLAALVGTATKYSECLLAVKFRQVDEDGHVVGGPFNYIEHEYVLPNNETVHALLESKKLLTAEEIPFTCVNVPIPKRPTPIPKKANILASHFHLGPIPCSM